MTPTIQDISITCMAEPVFVEIEKNSKGYNYRISAHKETLLGEDGAVRVVLLAKEQLEKALGAQP